MAEHVQVQNKSTSQAGKFQSSVLSFDEISARREGLSLLIKQESVVVFTRDASGIGIFSGRLT